MATADTRRAWREAERKKVGGRWAAVAAVAIVLVGGGGLWAVTAGGSDGTPTSCDSTVRISVVAEPSIAEALRAKPINPESCIRMEVTEQESSETAQRAASGQLSEPLWIPDSSGRLDDSLFDDSVKVHTDSLASSPAVVVSQDDSTAMPETWTELLEDDSVRLGEPETDGGSQAAMQGVAIEASEGEVPEDEAALALTRRAQTQGVTSPVLSPDELISSVQDEGGQSIVAEHDLLASGAAEGSDGLVARTPESGAAFLDYPLVQASGALSDNEFVQRAGDEIAAWFSSPEGQEALAGSSLRPADGTPLDAEGSQEIEPRLRIEDQEKWSEVAETYRRQAAPLNALVVVDASGSMGEPSRDDGQTRWDTTMNTVLLGSQLFPARDSLGMWLFASDLGPNGEPYKVVLPVRPIDEQVDGGKTQRELLQEAASEAGYQKSGRTELYETALAAFRRQQENWQPGAVNTVILLSDGGQQAAPAKSQTRIEDVVATLQEEQDPARPVYIVTLGISSDANDVALGAIAGATGGSYHQTTDEKELQAAFVEALSTVGS